MPGESREGTAVTAPPTGTAGAVPPAGPPAWTRPRCVLLFVLTALLGLAADLGTKEWAFRGLGWPSERKGGVSTCTEEIAPEGPFVEVIPCVFRIHTSLNAGGINGSFDGGGNWLAAFSVVAMIVVAYWFATLPSEQWGRQLALGMIFAGAAGNLYDRALVRPDVIETWSGRREFGLLKDDAGETIAVGGKHIPVRELVSFQVGTDEDSYEAVVRLRDGSKVVGGVSGLSKLLLYPNYDNPSAVMEVPLWNRSDAHRSVRSIRRHLGTVRDFFDVHYKDVWYYPIFNVADSLLCVGVGILLLATFGEAREDFSKAKKKLLG